jgi:hypothetical protein
MEQACLIHCISHPSFTPYMPKETQAIPLTTPPPTIGYGYMLRT